MRIKGTRDSRVGKRQEGLKETVGVGASGRIEAVEKVLWAQARGSPRAPWRKRADKAPHGFDFSGRPDRGGSPWLR